MDEIRWTKKLLLVSRYFIKRWTKNDGRWTKKNRFPLLVIPCSLPLVRYSLFHKRWTKYDGRKNCCSLFLARCPLFVIRCFINDGRKTIDDGRKKCCSFLVISLNDGRNTMDEKNVARYLLFHKRWTKNEIR